MNQSMKNQIYDPTEETVESIKEVEVNQDNLHAYNSADDLFDDLGIEA